MTDKLSEGGSDSTLSQPSTVEEHDANPVSWQGPRRQIPIAFIVIAALLAVTAAGFLVVHLVLISRGSPTLANERQRGLSDALHDGCPIAISLLTPVVAVYPSDFVVKKALGDCYLALHDFDSALPLLQDVATSRPDVSNEFGLASAAFNTGNSILGQSALRTAIALAITPSDFLSIAETADGFGYYPIAATALGDIKSVLRTYIWYDADAKTQLGLGYPSIAVAAARQAVWLSPELARGGMLADLGDSYVSAREYGVAANAYEEALATHQQINFGSVYVDLSQCYIQLGQYMAAVRASRSGIGTTTGMDQYTLELNEAMALADLHRTEEAINLLRDIVANRSTPTNIVASAGAMLSTLEG